MTPKVHYVSLNNFVQYFPHCRRLQTPILLKEILNLLQEAHWYAGKEAGRISWVQDRQWEAEFEAQQPRIEVAADDIKEMHAMQTILA